MADILKSGKRKIMFLFSAFLDIIYNYKIYVAIKVDIKYSFDS